MTEHGESVWTQLRRLIMDGVPPEDAAETVMADLPRRWRDWARPFVVRAASGLEGQIVNRRLRRAVGRGRVGQRHQAAAAERLHSTIYRLPDGTRVLWDDMTRDMIEVKIAQLKKFLGSLVDHLNILQAARDLLASNPDANRLGDITDWPKLVADAVAHKSDEEARASTGVQPSTPESTREPVASADAVNERQEAA